MVGTAKDFTGQITLRFPTVLTKAQCHCARVILTKEFNAAFPYILRPRVADSLVAGEVPRSGNNQARPGGVEECVRAGFSGMMLPLDDDVALQIQAACQQCLFRLDATVRHEQDAGRWRDYQVNNVGLIIGDRRAKVSRRKQDACGDIARQTETVPRSQIVWFDSVFSEQLLQSSVYS